MSTTVVSVRDDFGRESLVSRDLEAVHKGCWRDVKIGTKRSESRKKTRTDELSTTYGLDFVVPSSRSLVSEDDQSTNSKCSWRRTFNALIPSHQGGRTHTRREPISQNYIDLDISCSEQDIGDEIMSTTPQHLDDSFVREELRATTADCSSWRGFVSIGRKSIDQRIPASPDSSRKVRSVAVDMTPPRPKKKKEKRAIMKRKCKSGRAPPSSPVIPWGDYAAIQESQDLDQLEWSMNKPGSPGCTPKRKAREKLSLEPPLFFENAQTSVTSMLGMWDELTEETTLVESSFSESSSSSILEIGSNGLLPESDGLSFRILPEGFTPSVTPDTSSFLGRFNALYLQSNDVTEEVMKENPNAPRNHDEDKSLVASVPSVDDLSTSDHKEENKTRVRLIRFADEQGLPLEKLVHVGDETDPWAMGRIIVLFLDPVMKKFEFMQGQFSLQAGATVADLLTQLPSFAVDKQFASMEYIAMYGTSCGPRELNTNHRLFELDLAKREITVAVAKGASGEQLVNAAGPILTNDQITKAVKKATRMGRGLKYIKSFSEMEQGNISNLDNYGNSSGINVDFGLEMVICEGDPCRPHMAMSHQPPILETFETYDQFHHFDDNFDFGDDDKRYHGENNDPRQVMKYIHASLLATIGLAYSLATTR